MAVWIRALAARREMAISIECYADMVAVIVGSGRKNTSRQASVHNHAIALCRYEDDLDGL